MSSHLLSIIVGAPALAALIVIFLPENGKLAIRVTSLIAATISLIGSIVALRGYDKVAGGQQMVESYPLIPSLGVHLSFALDGWGGPLLLLTGVIIFAGVLASWTLKTRDKEYFALLLILVAGVFGVFVTQDLLVFFLFYEIAVLPMYLLIGIWGASHAVPRAGPFARAWDFFKVGDKQYAAMKLTLMLLVGSAAILVAIFALYLKAGVNSFDLGLLQKAKYDTDLQIILFPLLWLGFGSLAGVFPFHTWSPDGHASAPTAVSMLHAGVLMKLGAFGVMRVGMVLLPEGARFWVPVVGAVAAINVLYGAYCAMSQTDLKYIIAYSSVSHMGVVMLGAATLTPEGWNGAVFQMVAHGIMTGMFFALVGLVYERAHTRAVPKMGGFATVMPGVAAFFTLACMSSLGLPGTAGFVSEFLVFLGAWKAGHYLWAIPGVLGAFVTAIYVLKATRAIFWGPGPSHDFHDLSEAKGTEWAAPIVLGVCLLLFGLWPRVLLDHIDPGSGMYLNKVVKAPAPAPAVHLTSGASPLSLTGGNAP
ncbi:MAG: NADH-quinone oxidoreductase subunit M [Deltaproteobacteria bacterium]|nr:NADH-quinone oxidoreductase subunit M [Deltaproteobacteria bacterium]